MPSTINATTNGIVTIGDSVATLSLQTGGNTAVAIDTAQIVTLSKGLALLGSTSGSVALAAPAIAGTQSYTLPTAQPTANGQALTATTAGVMSWATAGGGTPGGSDLQFQYNNSSAFGGASNFTYNATGPIVATTIGVGAATPAASGAGITFPATQSASSNANTLDDYEKGTWTPVVQGDGTAGTYELQSILATYTKVGNLVSINAQVRLASSITGGGTGILTITGLPFNKGSFQVAFGPAFFNGVALPASVLYVITEFYSSGSSAQLFFDGVKDNAASAAVQISAVAANDFIGFSMTYQTS
jgi:hypothetical protein